MNALLILPLLAMAMASQPAELGDSLAAAFDNPGAAAAYEEALASAPDDFSLRCRHLCALIDAGEDAEGDLARDWFIRARDEAERLVAQFPDSALSHHYDAVASGRYAQFAGGKEKVSYAEHVRGAAERALEIDSGNAETWLTLGNYHYEVATLNTALRFFAKALYGAALEGGLDEAEAALVRALELDPTHIYAHLILARVRWEQKDWEGCHELCERIGELPIRDHLDPRNRIEARELGEKAAQKLKKLRNRR